MDRAVHRGREEAERKFERFARELDKMNLNGIEILKKRDDK